LFVVTDTLETPTTPERFRVDRVQIRTCSLASISGNNWSRHTRPPLKDSSGPP